LQAFWATRQCPKSGSNTRDFPTANCIALDARFLCRLAQAMAEATTPLTANSQFIQAGEKLLFEFQKAKK
jgi:cyclophilin family peptidyl-prolyl cis-trans isomerase